MNGLKRLAPPVWLMLGLALTLVAPVVAGGSMPKASQRNRAVAEVRSAEVAAAKLHAAQERLAARTAKCSQSGVRINTSPGIPSAGGFSQIVSVENPGTKACVVPLYPLLTFQRVGIHTSYTAGPGAISPQSPATSPVILKPGQRASAAFGGGIAPLAGQASCPSFISFTVSIALGTPVTFHTSVPNCSGLIVSPFVLGFTGLTPATGRVKGRVPECRAVQTSGLGPIVPVKFSMGHHVVLPQFVFASSKVSNPFDFDLAPGTYRVTSAHGFNRKVTVRVGEISHIGLFGSCVASPTIPTTTYIGGVGLTTTTTIPIFGQPASNPPAHFGSSIGPACVPSQLVLEFAGTVSEKTGQNTLALDFLNKSGTPCHMIGYPGISLFDVEGSPVPMTYRRGGDQMITTDVPRVVDLPAGARAYVLVNKYRCDLGEKALSASIRVIPPNTRSSLQLFWGSFPRLSYCGPGDPGSILDISPVEPTPQSTQDDTGSGI